MTKELTEVLVLSKRMGNLLDEVLELSRELAQATDRQDQVSMQMLIAMRKDPIEKLVMTEEALKTSLSALPDSETARRIALLLQGKDSGVAEEEPLARQIAANRRLHAKVLELDRILNQKVARNQSVYTRSKR